LRWARSAASPKPKIGSLVQLGVGGDQDPLGRGVDAGSFELGSLATVGELIEAGRFWLPVEKTFPLAQITHAHRISEHGHSGAGSC
jgi:NADPH:quinone reductase-like Zn-dependent oxidoreductase